MTDLNIFIENSYPDLSVQEALLQQNVVKMAGSFLENPELIKKSCLNGVEYNTVTFDAVLTDDEEIRRINKEYRNKDCPTDVITFAIFADSPENERFIFDGEVNLGEIIISVDKIKEQSKENNISFEDELYFIFAHGILHLLGFDHLNDSDYNFMVQNQNEAKALVL